MRSKTTRTRILKESDGPVREPGPKPGSGRNDSVIVSIRGRAEYKAWLNRLVEHVRKVKRMPKYSLSDIFDHQICRFAAETGLRGATIAMNTGKMTTSEIKAVWKRVNARLQAIENGDEHATAEQIRELRRKCGEYCEPLRLRQ